MDMRKLAGAVAASLTLVPVFSAEAKDEGWHGEITPYLWAAGIEDSLTVQGHKANVDVDFDDLLDKTNAGASIVGILQKNRLLYWGEVDYLDLDTDELTTPLGGTGHIDSTATVGTLAVGYQFDGFRPGQSIALFLGARQLSMDNELTLDGVGTFKNDMTITDAVLLIRPDFPLSDRWRFNPVLSYGWGDSEETCEVWPQFEYTAGETWAARVGYRKLRYDIEKDSNNKFDGTMHGSTVGLVYRF